LVYAKPALMLAELADTLGEDELLRRLRSILETHRYRSLGSGEFLDLLGGGDPGLRWRLNEWIFSRDLPGRTQFQETMALSITAAANAT
jgi:hypothetical protein